MIDPDDLPELSPHVPRWYAPIDPGLLVLQARSDFLLAQEQAEDEARCAERRAWLTHNNGWPPQCSAYTAF